MFPPCVSVIKSYTTWASTHDKVRVPHVHDCILLHLALRASLDERRQLLLLGFGHSRPAPSTHIGRDPLVRQRKRHPLRDVA